MVSRLHPSLATILGCAPGVRTAGVQPGHAADVLRRPVEGGEQDARAAQLDARKADLDTREAAITASEQAVAATQIKDGMWTVGKDLEPGTYRTAAKVTSTCWWGTYRTGSNGADIIRNDIVQGVFPSVTLKAGRDFESDCGVWNKQ